jgi:hypothetical protein
MSALDVMRRVLTAYETHDLLGMEAHMQELRGAIAELEASAAQAPLDAMKQALEALEMLAKLEHPASNITTKSGRIYPHHVAKNAAATLRLAIDQAERQEPVAYVSGYYAGHCVIEPLNRAMVMPDGMALYAAPPQRQPLTDGEIIEHFKARVDTGSLLSFADGVRFAERKHGIGETK